MEKKGFWDINPGFRHFVGIGGFRGFGSYSQKPNVNKRVKLQDTSSSTSSQSISPILSILSGGGRL
jgi:hypothetical protein